MALVLEALRRDQALDAGGLGVGFLAFALGLDFAADDEFADLNNQIPRASISIQIADLRGLCPACDTSRLFQ